MTPSVYSPRGLLAVAPSAIGLPLPSLDPSPGPSRCGQFAVVDVCGPLAHDAGQAMMSYSAIRAAVREALTLQPSAVVLRMHTPGGEVSGAFDCARGVEADCRVAGVQLIAFTDSLAASAGYALAAVADAIVLSDTASIGSVGVIAVFANQAAAALEAGIETTVLTSGVHKADGNPMVRMTDTARGALQQSVDAMAGVFFGHVREFRGIDAAPLEARIFVGQAAVDVGLADAVMSWDALTAALSTGARLQLTDSQPAAQAASGTDTMPSDDEKKDDKGGEEKAGAPKWLKALRAAADEGDEDAKSALAEYETKRAGAKAEHEEPDGDEEPKAVAPAAESAALASTVAQMAARQAAQEAELASYRARDAAREKADAAAKAAKERSDFFAANPHVSAELAKSFEGLSLETIKGIVEKMPRSAPNAAAEFGVAPTQGATGRISGLSYESPHAAVLDRKFGFVKEAHPLVIQEGNTRTYSAFGATTANAKSHLAAVAAPKGNPQ